MTPGQILIVSDDSEFVQSLSTGWRLEKHSPAVAAVSMDAGRQSGSAGFEFVVVGPLRGCNALPPAPAVHPDAVVCAVGDPQSLQVARATHGNWLLLPEYPGWTRILFALAREILRRTAAESRAREAEHTNLSQRRFSALGKSLLEARPGMVNAMTSLLGHADLILLSDEPLPVNCRENVHTIHTMALRLNEIMQRLASIENEMELSERESHVETRETGLAAMSGARVGLGGR